MKNYLKENWFKIIVVIILIGAIGTRPYSYYQVTRWITAICSAYLAFKYANIERFGWMWTFVALTILFNPILPFYFAKDTWKVLDILGSILFFISLFVNQKLLEKQHGKA